MDNKKNLQDRKTIIAGLMILVVVIFVLQLVNLQILNLSYKENADSNAFLKKIQYPARGLIYDRNGKLLVYNKPAYDVMIVMNEVESFDTLDFCNAVNIEKNIFIKLVKKLKQDRGYSKYTPQLLLSQLSVEEYAVLQEKLFKFPGFYIQNRTLREYTYPCAAHALGSVGEVSKRDIENDEYYISGDYAGKNGVEKFYEKELRGIKGIEILLRDSRGRIKGKYEQGGQDVDPVSGKTLTLSLDIELQMYGEQLMKGKIGSVVAIEPSTGEILALVSSPSFNPSDLVGRKRSKNFTKLNNDPVKPLLDRPLMARYPPGSTFKVVNSLIFQQEGIINPSTRFPCHMGFTAGRLHVGCHKHAAPQDLTGSLQHSCNAYYCQGLRSMIDNRKYGSSEKGFTTWKNEIVSFGFGYTLGVDFPNENRGYIPNAEVYNKIYGRGSWRALTIISIAIGQGEVLSTPIQTANLAASIANRGYWYPPHIVKKIQGENINAMYRKKRQTAVAPKYFGPTIDGMRMAVIGGTARIAAIDSVEVCGKTGTAQNPHGKDHSIFMAFAPKNKPKIAIAVFVENAGFGATWAGPIASLMMEKYLNDTISTKRKYLEERMFNTSLMPSATQH
jgi:penicillin-binding protein 2